MGRALRSAADLSPREAACILTSIDVLLLSTEKHGKKKDKLKRTFFFPMALLAWFDPGMPVTNHEQDTACHLLSDPTACSPALMPRPREASSPLPGRYPAKPLPDTPTATPPPA